MTTHAGAGFSNPARNHDQDVSLCPYCGKEQAAGAERCEACGGLFEPLSKQASQNEMGPWFIRDDSAPHRPGCSLQTLKRLIAKGRVKPETIVRGPSTRQFWSHARYVQGVAHLLGECHNCHRPARATDYMCRSCGAVFSAPTDRQYLGLGPIHLIPGQPPPDMTGVEGSASPQLRTVNPRPTSSSFSQGNTTQPPGSLGADRTAGTLSARRSGEGLSPAATRRLKHRLARAEKTAAALAALSIVFLAALIATLTWSGFGGAWPSDGAPTASALDPAQESSTRDQSAVKQIENNAEDSPSPASDGETIVAPRDQGEAEAKQWLAQRNEALKRAEQGGRDAVASALRQLRKIREQSPADARPPDLDRDIARLERRLDELALREFLQRENDAGDT